MRHTIASLTAALMVLSLAGLALGQAQTTPPAAATPPAGTDPAKPAPGSAAKPAGKAAGVKHMTGEVVSVNAETKTLTVRHTGKKKAKDMTFSFGGDATGSIASLKPGDEIRVAYKSETGKLVAQSVTHSKHPANK